VGREEHEEHFPRTRFELDDDPKERTCPAFYSLYRIHNLSHRQGSDQSDGGRPSGWQAHMTKKGGRSVVAKGAGAEPRRAGASLDSHGLEDMLGHRLHLAYRVHLQRFASVGAPHNVRASQFSILNFVYCHPLVKQAELANALGKKHANVVTALDELQQRGLILRMRDPADRRSRVLRLTPTGEKVTVELMERYAELNRDLRNKLGARELDRLLELLREFSRLGE
jgi:DNA-binding MarR family transcriptional regulator